MRFNFFQQAECINRSNDCFTCSKTLEFLELCRDLAGINVRFVTFGIDALKDKDVIVMSVNGDKVTEDGRILTDRGQRIRDVRTGPDGYLYVLTDESSGELLKVSPRN